jgi:transcriptional regulator with GAF, ATPase, and Fis domain
MLHRENHARFQRSRLVRSHNQIHARPRHARNMDTAFVARLEQPGPIEHFYQLLLQLDRRPNATSQLGQALLRIVEITGARTAYVEIFAAGEQRALSRGHDVEGRTHDAIATSISRDIVALAVDEGRTISRAIRRGRTAVAVLCVPIKAESVIGFVWLERTRRAFSELDRERARLLARSLCAARASWPKLADELRALRVRRVREALERCNGKISAAARMLGVSRVFIYAVTERRPSCARCDL